jgi:putative intracellular protease/amidase
VIVTSNSGTEITDSLPPYEILAASGIFNVYFVAPERRVSPIDSALALPGFGRVPAGLDILPHYGFAEYDRVVGHDPDLIVIPFLPRFDPVTDRPILDWIRAHAGPRTTLLTICAGTRVLAETGLLDGRAATSFHRFIPDFEQRYPAVRWQRNLRWVDDGNIITSGSLTAGVDATLHTLDRLAGRAVAQRTASLLGYSRLQSLDDPSFQYQPPAKPDLGMLPHWLYRWGTADLGVVLHEGVSETTLAALLDSSILSLTRIHTVAPERGYIRSRHGMIMVPRFSFANAPSLDGVLIPGDLADPATAVAAGRWAQQRGRPAAHVLASGAAHGFAYDTAIVDLARREGQAVARAAAVNLVYPLDPALLAGPARAATLLEQPLLLGLLGLALAAGLDRRRSRRGAVPAPASG